jgi:hypothetical protein
MLTQGVCSSEGGDSDAPLRPRVGPRSTTAPAPTLATVVAMEEYALRFLSCETLSDGRLLYDSIPSVRDGAGNGEICGARDRVIDGLRRR